ncbi:MAG: hypothetical protein WC740_12630 [Verrucomicrobiia bacterium]
MKSFQVPDGAVNWFKTALNNHGEVISVEVTDRHFFKIVRKKDPQEVNVVFVDIYSVGLADVLKARQEFPDATCIVTNGNWNACTPEAKEYGLENGFGVFNTPEFLGALHWEEIHKYHKKDQKR